MRKTGSQKIKQFAQRSQKLVPRRPRAHTRPRNLEVIVIVCVPALARV